jgi:hypothetical protein
MYPPKLVLKLQIVQLASKLMDVVIATFREELAYVSLVSAKPSVQLLERDGILTTAHHQS